MKSHAFKRWIKCVFTSISLLILPFVPFAGTVVHAYSGDLLVETFDSYAVGQSPPGWTVPKPPAAVMPSPSPYIVKATVEELPGTPGRMLELRKNGKSTSSYNISRTIANATAKLVMSYRVRAEQTDAVFYLPTPQSGSVVLAKLSLYNGQFAYMKKGGTAWTTIQPYSAGVWYDVRIMLDTDADTFTLSINGEPKLSAEPAEAGGSVTSLYLGIYKDSIGAAYFDDLFFNSYKPANSAQFAQPSFDLAAGSSQALPLLFDPADATDQSAVWSSDQPGIASVSGNGVVTGLAVGKATITARPRENIPSASVKVNVYEVPVTGITVVNPQSPSLPVGSRAWLQAIVAPDNSTNKTIVWGSDNPQVAAVDGYGEVTGVAPGTATVYAATPDGKVRGETKVTVVARAVQKQLYVSPSGDDVNPGTEQAPFRTIAKAQAAVRGLNFAMTGDIVVNLRGGTYVLDKELQFASEDSGKNGYFVTYRSYPGEKAIISGGQTVDGGWELHDSALNIYQAHVGHELQTRQLFVDGVRAVRARSVSGLINPVKTATGYTSDDTLLPSLRSIDDLEFVYQDLWTNSRAGVQSVTGSGGKAQITMEEPAWTAISNRGLTSATVPAYYENAYELLDEPGEWYYDRTAGMLYYKPRAWEQLSTVKVVAPVLEKLLNIQGYSADDPVRNLQFENLEFAYTTWMRPSTSYGHSDAQNNHLRYPGTKDTLPDAAITIQLANTVNFERNTFTKLGISAIRMDNGVQNSLIQGNHFYDISGSALNVGQPYSSDPDVYRPADPRKIMKNDDVVNNLIHDIGVDYKSASAISAGYPVDMDIRHNEIFSIPYSGTHIGYGWGAQFNPVTRNVQIENNLIYDLLGMGLRDGGAIYSLGTTGASAADPNVVSGNYIRNQMEDSAVLYADEGSAYWKYENNVIDLKDTPPWHGQQRWAQVWLPTIHDQFFNNNYTTQSYYVNNGTNSIFVNTHVVPDANWSGEALAIIDNAGLQPGFRDVALGVVPRVSADPINLAIGVTGTVVVYGQSGKDQPLGLGSSTVHYASRNPAVAVVDAQGHVTGVSRGSTKLDVSIVNGSVLRHLALDVFVGDTLSDIRLSGEDGHVLFGTQGETKELQAYGNTLFGNKVSLGRTEFFSSNPEVASVSADGLLTAHHAGATVLTIKGDFLDNTKEGYYLYKVVDSSTADDYGLRSEIGDADSWTVNATGSGNIQQGTDSITVATPGGYSVYSGRKFLNELLDFNLRINGAGSWYALSLGNPSSQTSYTNGSTYLVAIGAGGIDLYRFNSGQRTVIYGNLPGYTSVGGGTVPNTMLPYNETHRVQLGTFRQGDGVRIIMKVEGIEVFNFLDTDKTNALSDAGYFGLIARSGSITLSRTDHQQPAVAGLAIDGLSGIQAGERRTVSVTVVYENGDNGPLASGVSFSSSDARVADVDSNGNVTARLPGTAIIIARYGSVIGSYPLTVQDTIPPVTVGKLTPAEPDGANGWYVHPVTVNLLATDQGDGVASTVYSQDGGITWIQYTGAFTVSLDGPSELKYRSTDKAGNAEAVGMIAFRMDSAGPKLEVAGVEEDGSYEDAGNLQLQVHVIDAQSGVDDAQTSIVLDGKPYPNGSIASLYSLPLGAHTLTVTAVDLAGNRSVKTIHFQTVTSIQSLQDLVQRFTQSNLIDNAGLANSLMSKIKNGNLQSFVREVQAQSGKHITAEAAQYLIRDAQALILQIK
ncbi:Ig-like domain-containing protein [Paenibacillus sp. sptzw28]|uniref:Ig-like domain-containing protein n=1 Tax=Paenibacillus sp. sptzw28 TaxID=715179 RepID=UPI001C6E0347|nr:Ig-like domain-containing protein [Paenibacillus sp. sptzw28]QYR21751.1 Ig-like domain-containing protein [Paenibacillus sp. sptzw28]